MHARFKTTLFFTLPTLLVLPMISLIGGNFVSVSAL